MGARILYVDNNPTDLEIYSEMLRLEGFHVDCVNNGQDALPAFYSKRPDLIMLDDRLSGNSPGGITGVDLAKQLRALKSNIPILIFTNFTHPQRQTQALQAGADYLDKGSSREILIAKVTQLLGLAPELPEYAVFSVTPSNSLHFAVSGLVSVSWEGMLDKLDKARFNLEMSELAARTYEYHDRWLELRDNSAAGDEGAEYLESRRKWRVQASWKGRDLYEQVLKQDSTFMRQWGAAENAFKGALERIYLRFKGGVENLALPFELLQDGQKCLAVYHPISRQISQAPVSGDTWRSFLKKRRGRKLRFLALAGEPAAVLEVKSIVEQLIWFQSNLDVEVEVSPPTPYRPVTLEEAEALLEHKNFDIIHYAGDGVFNQRYPELSYIVFTQKNGLPARMTASRLHNLLAGSATQFLYLSCCSGAEIASRQVIMENTYIGLLHAAIMAGVPSALGYRWPVVGLSAERFASSFYRELAKDPSSLESAVLRARQKIFDNASHDTGSEKWSEGGWDDAWFSPVLIVQNPDQPENLVTEI